jgi:signal peptidase I
MPDQDNPDLISAAITAPAAEPPKEMPAAASGGGLWSAFSWLRDLAFSVLIAVVSIVFIYQPVKVEGTSMMPALTDQERIFINKFTYRLGLGSIERGDVVVFEYPVDRSKSFIKRVIGLPGDRVRIDRGQVYVNDRPLVEDYVEPEFRDDSSMQQRVVGTNEYFVLGDHRNSSSDSRIWKNVPRGNIYGKAVFCYWPLNRMGRLK